MTSSRGHAHGHAVVITGAREAQSRDADRRNVRYLWTMAIRVACFLGGVSAPSPFNWVLFAGAAVIPPIAVMLANAVDRRRDTEDQPAATVAEKPALTPGETISGSVED